MLRVLLLEDEALLRAMLAATLPDETMTVVGAFGDAKSAVAAAAETPFDVLVTDLDLLQGPGPNGIVVANVIRRTHPDAGIVLLTSYADPRLIGAKLSQVPDRTEYLRKQDVHDVAFANNHLAGFVEELVHGDHALGLVADINHDFVGGDSKNGALDDFAFREVAEAVIVKVE